MGIAVPEDFRKEMAMAGDWQTISQRRIEERAKKEEGLEDFKDFKPDLTLNVGVRKRKFDGQEEEEEAGATVVRKGWGSTTRHYPGSDDDNQEVLDSLLNNAAVRSPNNNQGDLAEASLTPGAGTTISQKGRSPVVPEPSIKKEEPDSLDMEIPQQGVCPDIPVKEEDGIQGPAVMFKKRRSKPSGKA